MRSDTAGTPGPVRGSDGITTSGSSTVVPFAALGLATPVRLAGIAESTSLFLPVPTGLTAATLTGSLVGAFGTPAGDVEFSSAGHRLATIHFSDEGSGSTPFTVPLDGVPAVNGQLRVDVGSSLPLADVYCQGQFLIPEVDLDPVAVTYTGQAAPPSSVGAFLPPLLSRLRVWVPAGPTTPAAEGAIEVADEVVSHYGSAPVTVEVKQREDALPDPGPFDPLTRDVVFGNPFEVPGARLVSSASGAPLLVFAGDGDGLRHQVDVFVTDLVKLVAGDQVTAGGQFIPRRIPAAEQRFSDLGSGRPRRPR